MSTRDGLGKRFGAVTAVEDLNLEIKPGNVTAFLGPDGFHPGRSGRDHLRIIARAGRLTHATGHIADTIR